MSYLVGNETDEELEGKCILLGVCIKQGEYRPSTGEAAWYAVHPHDRGIFFFKVGSGQENDPTYDTHHRHADKRVLMQAVLKAFDNGVEAYRK